MRLDLQTTRPYLKAFTDAVMSWDFGRDTYPYALEADREWQRRLDGNPNLWRGDVLSVAAAELEDGHLNLRLEKSDFGRYLYERTTTNRPSLVRILYVSALVRTSDHCSVVVEMSSSTSAPGLIQLPGGNVDLSDLFTGTTDDLRRAALRELAEEVGALSCRADPCSSLILAVSSVSVGVLVPFLTDMTSDDVRYAFDALVQEEPPEISAVHLPPEWDALDGIAPHSLHANLGLLASWSGGEISGSQRP
ncbi:NUDIX hydrolase [Yimella sp. cx-573]|nr:NUDIX hydrolase [Yimella sp. cx-573]